MSHTSKDKQVDCFDDPFEIERRIESKVPRGDGWLFNWTIDLDGEIFPDKNQRPEVIPSENGQLFHPIYQDWGKWALRKKYESKFTDFRHIVELSDEEFVKWWYDVGRPTMVRGFFIGSLCVPMWNENSTESPMKEEVENVVETDPGTIRTLKSLFYQSPLSKSEYIRKIKERLANRNKKSLEGILSQTSGDSQQSGTGEKAGKRKRIPEYKDIVQKVQRCIKNHPGKTNKTKFCIEKVATDLGKQEDQVKSAYYYGLKKPYSKKS